jgi:hypothetical protein
MKAFILTDSDFEALLSAIDRDPQYGERGGSSGCLSEGEKSAHDKAHRFFNYQIRTWMDQVRK